MRVVLIAAALAAASVLDASTAVAGNADGIDVASIRSSCAAKWAGDFEMQAYCIDKQRRALATLQTRSFRLPPEWKEETEALCKSKWSDDAEMRVYCLQKQEAAARHVSTGIDGMPSSVSEAIASRCSTQWRPDIEMMVYCIRKQAAGWKSINH